MALTIGQLARSSGVAARTIRYYEHVGVLPAPRRTRASYRQYTEHDLHRLVFIRRARALGLSVRQLTALTTALNGAARGSFRPRLRTVVEAHLRAVHHKIGELAVLQRQLEQVLRHLEGPSRSPENGTCRCLDAADVPAGDER